MYKLITEKLIEKNLTISTMESCTGGLIASLLTDTEGASNTIKGSFVTYSNEAKILQGVSEKVIKEKGVYSINTATEMARACKKTYNSNIGVGITGTFSNVDLPEPDLPNRKTIPLSGNFSDTLSKAVVTTFFV